MLLGLDIGGTKCAVILGSRDKDHIVITEKKVLPTDRTDGEKVSFCASLNQLHTLTARNVAEAAFAGDPLAIEIYKVCGHYLGRGIALLVDIINPEIIILGSIFGRVRPLIEAEMWSVIKKEALADSVADCRIVPAGLGESIGDMAALTLADYVST
jgi:glucokinase